MKFNVEWKRKATKQLFKMPQVVQKRIMDGVGKLSDSETWGDVRKLVNHQYSHRLRIGDYRVLFDTDVDSPEIEHEIRILEIQEVKKRDERTY
nr:MAG TPA: Cytotoxic translational repressor [Caudoviricetes sp.]